MRRILFLNELKDSLYLGVKFGVVGSVTGFVLHFIWGNLDTISYTLISGFLIGYFVGFFELFFSHPKSGRLPYTLLLFLRTIIYFLITLLCVYLLFRIYLAEAGYSREVLSDPMIYAKIEDEVIVIWTLKQGLKNNNCINSYFLASDILDDKKDYYFNRYNTFPSFKVSLHVGEVTITEVGVSKKEFVYHGDTINTASRICASAHKLGRNILISKELYRRIKPDTNIVFEDLGKYALKGKDEKIHIYSMRLKL